MIPNIIHYCWFGGNPLPTDVKRCIGISIAANKIPGIRCGVGYCDEVARAMRLHNDANMIAFGQDYMDLEDVKKRVELFLSTEFLGDYHTVRIKQISRLEKYGGMSSM